MQAEDARPQIRERHGEANRLGRVATFADHGDFAVAIIQALHAVGCGHVIINRARIGFTQRLGKVDLTTADTLIGEHLETFLDAIAQRKFVMRVTLRRLFQRIQIGRDAGGGVQLVIQKRAKLFRQRLEMRAVEAAVDLGNFRRGAQGVGVLGVAVVEIKPIRFDVTGQIIGEAFIADTNDLAAIKDGADTMIAATGAPHTLPKRFHGSRRIQQQDEVNLANIQAHFQSAGGHDATQATLGDCIRNCISHQRVESES